jgi:hypothetical protein
MEAFMLDSSTYFGSRRVSRRRKVSLEWIELVCLLLLGIAITALIINLPVPQGAGTDFLFLG